MNEFDIIRSGSRALRYENIADAKRKSPFTKKHIRKWYDYKYVLHELKADSNGVVFYYIMPPEHIHPKFVKEFVNMSSADDYFAKTSTD